VALGDRRIFTAASLRVSAGCSAGLRVLVPVEDFLVFRAVGLGAARPADWDGSARGVRVLRVLASDLAAAERVAGLFAVRKVRAVVAGLVDVLRVGSEVARLVPRALAVAFAARGAAVRVPRVAVAADFGRPGALRAVVEALARVVVVRVAVVRVDAARAGARVVGARFAAGAALARVVFFGAAALADAALVVRAAAGRAAAGRVALARLAGALAVRVVAALAGRVAFAAGFVAFGTLLAFAPSFLAAVERADAVVPVRVVRAVALRALEPAVRRPPARTAIARVRGLSFGVSVVMIGNLCSMEMMAWEGTGAGACRRADAERSDALSRTVERDAA
jgi:hypothetical protein